MKDNEVRLKQIKQIKVASLTSWDDNEVRGLADTESHYVWFRAEAGKKPVLENERAFEKNKFKSYDEFCDKMGKFSPYTEMLLKPFETKSLNYAELIGICRDKYPDYEAPEDPSKPGKLRQVPIPDDDFARHGDTNYAETREQRGSTSKIDWTEGA